MSIPSDTLFFLFQVLDVLCTNIMIQSSDWLNIALFTTQTNAVSGHRRHLTFCITSRFVTPFVSYSVVNK